MQHPVKTLAEEDRSALRRVIGIAWPAMVESFFQAATALIDSFMLSGLGYSAIASVGLTQQPKFISISPFIALSMAVNALSARRKGQRDRLGAHQILLAALLFSCFGGLLIGTLCAGLSEELMRLAGSDAKTAQSAVYFRIVMGGIVFHVVSLAINSAQRGSGRTNLSMRTNVVSALVNMLFNWLLIGGNLGFPRWGIAGAATATVLGSAVGCAMSILSLFSKDSFLQLRFLRTERVRVTRTAAASIWNIASSALLENILIRVGFMATALMAAGLGAEALAAHNVGLNLLTLSFSVGDGFQAAALSLIGQCLGAKEPDRAKHYGKVCHRLGMAAATILTLLYLLFGRRLFELFFLDSPQAVLYGTHIVRWLVVVIVIQVSQVVYIGALRGAGDARYVMMALIISVTVVRAGTGYLLCEVLDLGLDGLWISIAADQLSRWLLTGTRFRRGKWAGIEI